MGRYNTAGIGHVGSYQVSGIPFVTGSATIAGDSQEKITFPLVTKSVTVINRGSSGTLRVHFTDKDQGNTVQGLHYITLDSKEDSFTFDVKCKEIYISTADSTEGAYELYASLTRIDPSMMFPLTGSGIDE